MRWLARALAKLLRTWWYIDRIRASPAEVRLLELQPPCVTMSDGEAVEVLGRWVQEAPDGPRIVYECLRPGGRDRLLVRPGEGPSRPRLRWIGLE